MSNVFQQAIRHQFETSVSMPREAIEACPDDLWDDRTAGTPFWHVAYQALFYTDVRLSRSRDDFQPPDSHIDRHHFFPGDVFGRAARGRAIGLCRRPRAARDGLERPVRLQRGESHRHCGTDGLHRGL